MKFYTAIFLMITSLLFVPMNVSSKNKNQVVLTEANTVSLEGPVNITTVSRLQLDIVSKYYALPLNETLYLVINSPGGEIHAGLRLVNFLKSYPKIKTITLYGASMAHAIAQSTKGERLGTEDTVMMAHRARGGFQGQFSQGEVESRLKFWTQRVTKMEKINAERMKIALFDYRKKVMNEWWCYSDGCLNENFIDRVIEVSCDKELATSYREITNFRLNFAQLRFDKTRMYKSKCPLIIGTFTKEEIGK